MIDSSFAFSSEFLRRSAASVDHTSIALFASTERKANWIGKWPFMINFFALCGVQMTSNIFYAVGDLIRGEFDPGRWYYVNLMAWVTLHLCLRLQWIPIIYLRLIPKCSALRTTRHWFGAFSYFIFRKWPYIWHFQQHSATIQPSSSVLGSIWRHFAMTSLTFSARSTCAPRIAEGIGPISRWIRCYAVPLKYKCKHQSEWVSVRDPEFKSAAPDPMQPFLDYSIDWHASWAVAFSFKCFLGLRT